MITDFFNSQGNLELASLEFKNKSWDDIIGSLEIKSPKKAAKNFKQHFLPNKKAPDSGKFAKVANPLIIPETQSLLSILKRASLQIPFPSFYSFCQKKLFEMLSKLEKKVEATANDELLLQLLSVSLQSYPHALSEKSLQQFCHVFILTQMVWAKLIESQKDTGSLTLIVGLIAHFLGSLEAFFNRLGKGILAFDGC